MTPMIRPAEVGDVPAIAFVIQDALRDPSDENHIVAAIQHPDHDTFVAIKDDRVVGFVDGFSTVAQDGARRWEMDLIAILPDYQQQGVGLKLTQQCIEAGRKHDAAFVRALIALDNIGSQRMAESAGFRILDPQIYTLYTSRKVLSGDAVPGPDAHLIQVQTLAYDGIWLEGDLTERDVEAALIRRTQDDLGLVGAVIPLENKTNLRIVQDASFEGIGDYNWWQFEY